MYTLKRGNTTITCQTSQEAMELIRHFEEQDRAKYLPRATPWTGVKFFDFIESLGTTQRRVLRMLVENGKVSDEELKKALKLESNQQLAGVLSGISKQAARRDVPARMIFRIENEFTSGTSAKFYVVADEFRDIAQDSNWPDGNEK